MILFATGDELRLTLSESSATSQNATCNSCDFVSHNNCNSKEHINKYIIFFEINKLAFHKKSSCFR